MKEDVSSDGKVVRIVARIETARVFRRIAGVDNTSVDGGLHDDVVLLKSRINQSHLLLNRNRKRHFRCVERCPRRCSVMISDAEWRER